MTEAVAVVIEEPTPVSVTALHGRPGDIGPIGPPGAPFEPTNSYTWTADQIIEANLNFQQPSDAQPRLNLGPDGALLFGDGINPPETLIRRNPLYSGLRVEDLAGNGIMVGINNVTIDGDGPFSQMAAGNNHFHFVAVADPMNVNASQGFQMFDGAFASSPRWTVFGDGNQAWSDGTNPPDVTLRRLIGGQIAMDAPATVPYGVAFQMDKAGDPSKFVSLYYGSWNAGIQCGVDDPANQYVIEVLDPLNQDAMLLRCDGLMWYGDGAGAFSFVVGRVGVVWQVGDSSSSPLLQVSAAGDVTAPIGDVETVAVGKGYIARSPDGTKRARIGIDNTGALSVTAL